MSAETLDVVFLLNSILALQKHEVGGPDALAAEQARVKDYIADKPDLEDPELLTALDQALKLASSTQVSVARALATAPFNLTDYVAPAQEPEPSAESTQEVEAN